MYTDACTNLHGICTLLYKNFTLHTSCGSDLILRQWREEIFMFKFAKLFISKAAEPSCDCIDHQLSFQ